jgi:hypothetical protein
MHQYQSLSALTINACQRFGWSVSAWSFESAVGVSGAMSFELQAGTKLCDSPVARPACSSFQEQTLLRQGDADHPAYTRGKFYTGLILTFRTY